MNALPIIKLAAEAIGSVGVGAVVSNAIKATTPADLTKIQKVTVAVGSIVLGGIASKAASNYVTEQIDELHELFSKKKSDPETPADN